MSAVLIRRVVEVFIALFAIGGLLKVARSIGALNSGEFGQLSWPIQAADLTQKIDLSDQAMVHLTYGYISVGEHPFAGILDLAIDLSFIVLFIVALLALRRLLMRFSEGNLFDEQNIAGLRRIGFALLTICGLSLAQVFFVQPMILSAVEMPADMVLHPSISWDVAGMQNVWLDYEVPIFTFVLGGIAILFSQAFKIGLDFRKDSESVV